MDFIALISKIINPVSLMLSFIAIFQWYKQYAKEQSIKNNLVAMKIILDSNPTKENKVLGTVLDATLATIGARPPFIERVEKSVLEVINKFKIASNSRLKNSCSVSSI